MCFAYDDRQTWLRFLPFRITFRLPEKTTWENSMMSPGHASFVDGTGDP
jgi:hypothetical protein